MSKRRATSETMKTPTMHGRAFKAPRKKKAVSQNPSKFIQDTGDELKIFDTTNTFNIDTTGEVPATGQLNLVPQGTDEDERVGNKMVIKSIQMRGTMVYSPGASANACDVSHMYLVLDTQANGAAAAVTDVFNSSNLAVAMRNHDNQKRFKILRHFEHVWNTGAGVTTAYNQMAQPYFFYTKCNIPINYSGATGAIGEIRKNNLFLLAGTAAQSDDLIAVLGLCRITYSDK